MPSPMLEAVFNADTTSIPAVFCKGNQWIIQWGNPKFHHIADPSERDFTNKSFLHHLNHLNFAAVSSSIDEVPAGTLAPYRKGGYFYGLTWHWIDSSQEDRIVLFYRLPLEQIARKSVLYWKELESLFDSMHDGLWVVDGNGTTLRVNKAMERIAGVKAEQVIGKPVSEAVNMGLTSTCITLQALEAGQAVTMFDDYANGTRCLNTSTPIFDENGDPWRVIACIRDISELDSLQHKLHKAEMEAKLYRDKLRSLESGHEAGYRGDSTAMRQLHKEIEKAGQIEAPVLLLGETGTGKTMTAHTIRTQSARAEEPMISVNCGAIPAELLEAELFGYEPGAFSGASEKGKPGMFELADGGTLFLDEVAELPLHMQVKLLHVLDGEGYRRVGGTRLFKPDVRIIAATNKSFRNLLEAGEFREDLYYRLRVLVVRIPPLRDRLEDIPSLAAYFLDQANAKYNLHKRLDPEVINVLMTNPWPGNVRELRATIELLAAMSENDMITVADLPPHLLPEDGPENIVEKDRPLKEAVEDLERRLITNALIKGRSTYKAARLLKMSQSSIVRKAQKYKIGIAQVAHEG